MQIVQASVLAVVLIFVGYLVYHEAMTWNKIAGIIVCLAGLAYQYKVSRVEILV